jgi:hypothetical protein
MRTRTSQLATVVAMAMATVAPIVHAYDNGAYVIESFNDQPVRFA